MRALEPKTDEWRAVGLGTELDRHGTGFYLGEIVVMSAGIITVLVAFAHRRELLPGSDLTARILTMVILIILGWLLARALGRGLGPPLLRRLDPGTAGTVGFLLRLFTFAVVTVVALRVAGLDASTLAAGGAFTAVIVGLAAQQTLGNLIAGLVLQTTRPFRAGERVRFINGMFAGPIEGVVAQMGLLHTTLLNGGDRMVVPNREILAAAIQPLHEPDRVEVRTRFPVAMGPSRVQTLLDEQITTPLRQATHIVLEGIDGDEVLLRIHATPLDSNDGGRLAEEIIRVVGTRGVASDPPVPVASNPTNPGAAAAARAGDQLW